MPKAVSKVASAISAKPYAKPTAPAACITSDTSAPQITSLEKSHRLDLQGADIYYVEDFVADEKVRNEWYEGLKELDSWYQPKLKMYGREITQSRSIAAYATEPSLKLKYSGQEVDMKYIYPPLLRRIQDSVEDKLGVTFNHVMLNWYQDGEVYIGNHRDNKENKIIASLSLGVPRKFILAHDRLPPKAKTKDPRMYKEWSLSDGSLLVMQGETQKFWKHQIPKEKKIKEGRISLTFRQLIY